MKISKILRFFLSGILLILIAHSILNRKFESLEVVGYDAALWLRTRLNPADTRHLPIVFLTIDDGTLKSKEFKQFPIPRDRYAVVLDTLREWGAKQVVFDILFVEPSGFSSAPGGMSPDEVFLSAIKRFENSGGDVLLPYAVSTDSRGERRVLPVYHPFASATEEIERLKRGFINTEEDIDGKMRFLIVREKDKSRLMYQYHMALVSVLNHLGVRPRDIQNGPNCIDVMVIRPDKTFELKHIPLYRENRLYLDYPGRWKDSFNKISFGDVYHLGAGMQMIEKGKIRLDSEEGRKILKRAEVYKSLVKDRTCVIGLTAAGTHDLRPTPLETSSPMVSVYGVVFSQVWQNRYIHRMATLWSVVIFLVLSALSLIKFRSLAKLWTVYGALAGVWLVFAILLFVYKGWWFDFLSPVLGGLVLVVASSVRLYLDTVREREKAEQEMRLAAEIQSQMLPDELPNAGGLSMEVFFSPAVFVAGDFYDAWIKKGGVLRVLMGDVSGKGVSAALYVAQVITAERVLRSRFENREISELMEELNRFLARFKISGVYATACMLELTPGKIVVSDAGHLSIWVYRSRSGEVEEVKLNTGAPLGVDRWSEYKTMELDWEKGDVIMVFSDGLIEARVGEEFIDENLVKEWVVNHISEECCSIGELMSSFYGKDPQSDDITLLIIRNEGKDDGPGQAN